MKLNKGWRGYISSREIAGNIIPQRIQNLVIRNYAQAKEMLFLLSATEYYMDNCYMMLNRLLEETDNLAGIIFYSINLLPLDLLKRKQIYRKILEHGCELHFALEELVIREEDDLELVEDVIVCRSLASKSNQIKLLEV
jgi:sporadic carbohydrate cluster protein (TIGR04323 family)